MPNLLDTLKKQLQGVKALPDLWKQDLTDPGLAKAAFADYATKTQSAQQSLTEMLQSMKEKVGPMVGDKFDWMQDLLKYLNTQREKIVSNARN